MKFVRFSQRDDEVLVDLEDVSHINKKIAGQEYLEELRGKTMVSIVFKEANESLVFFGKDAENVWDNFISKFNIA